MQTLFEKYFQQAFDAMLIIDPFENKVLQANMAAEQLFGLSQQTLIRSSGSALFKPSMSILVVFTEEVLEKHQAWSSELTIQAGDRKIEVEVSASLLRLGDALSIGMVLRHKKHLNKLRQAAEVHRLHRDGLAYWKTIETVFREFERENDLILKAVGDGIYGVNTNGEATFVNPAAEKILGWRADEMIGKNMHKMVHHSHGDGTHYHGEDCHIYAAFRDGAVRYVDNEMFWRKDGKPIPVEYTSTPIMDAGRLVGAVVIFRDISERKQAEENLRSALNEVQQLKQQLEQENAYLQEEYRSEHNYKQIVGKSGAVHKIIQQIDLVAPTDANVLIIGESGTGKELIARAIHEASGRKHRPLIRVNCASIPRELFESEFFGHVKGAFTGAIQERAGRFELAHGGTLFLDEVGEIPLELQGKLLRVLQEQQFEKVGDSKTRTVDVRIIAATNKDLKQEVAMKRFREDLYFRLNVFPIESFPLRQRQQDIPILANHFLQMACQRFSKPRLQLTLGDIAKIQAYSWPGNIRELINVIERAVILSQGKKLRLDLPDPVVSVMPVLPQKFEQKVHTKQELKNIEMLNIINALKQCNGKVFGSGGAAELMNLKPTTLASRIKILGINRYEYIKPHQPNVQNP